MNFKNLLKFSTLAFLFTIVLSSLSFAQVRYLNSTDGDDSYTGVNETNSPLGTGPKKTIEGAYSAFPTNSTVYMKAGEYHYNQITAVDANGASGGNDDNGVQFDSPAKNMTFIIQTYNSSSVVYLNGTVAGAFVVNAPGKTIKFQGADPATQSVSINNGPFFNTATNAITLTAGTLDVSGLLSFNVGGSVTTMTRTGGTLVGSFTYSAAARTMLYNSAAADAQTSGGELQTALSGASDLNIAKTGGSLSITQNLTMTTGGTLRNTGTGSATISGTVTIAGAAAAPSTISLTGTGALTLSNTVTISSRNETWGTFINKNGAGTLTISGALNINHGGTTGSDLDDGAAYGAWAGGTNIVKNNNTTGKLSLSGLITFGKYTDGVPADWYVYVTLSNIAGATTEIGNTTSVWYGKIENDGAAGKINLVGNLTMKSNAGALVGPLSNNSASGIIALGGNTLKIATAAAGAIRNAGSITSTAAGLLDFNNPSTSGTITFSGTGAVPNIQTDGTQSVDMTPTTTVNGNVTVNATAGILTLSGVTSLTGNISLVGGQAVTNLGGITAIGGNVSLTLGTLTMGGNATIAGSLTLSGGTFVMGGNVTLSGNYVQNSGTLNFNGANTLDCKQNFTRTTGNVTNAAGVLQFSSGGQGQILAGGANFRVYTLTITGVGTGVTLSTGSVEVVRDCNIAANTSLQLASLNINMVGAGGTITNGGQIFSSGLGSVIFSGPDAGGVGTTGSVSTIGGTGKYSNIEIRLTDASDVVTCAANVVSWTGRLGFTRGGIDNSAGGAQLNPIDGAASIVINMSNYAATGFPQGKPYAGGANSFNTTGSFDVLNVPYDLTYWGNITTGAKVAGNEFKTLYVRDLSVTSTGATATDFVEFGAAYTMVGNLSIPAGSQLNLNGSVLTASKTGAAHNVAGLLSSTALADAFTLTGDGTVTGSTTAADVATIENLIVNTSTVSAAYTFNNFHAFGKTGTTSTFNMTAGTATLNMYQTAAPVPSPLYNFVQSGGTVVLANNARISTGIAASQFSLTGGTFDFANYNLWFSVAGTFSATGGTFLTTGATTGGYLQFRTTGATFNSGTVAVPRVDIDPLLAGTITVTLGGNSVISDIFNNNMTTSTLATGGNVLTLSGTGPVKQWNTSGLYTGAAGLFYITGPVTMNLGVGTIIPNLQVDNTTTGTFTLVDNDGVAGTVPDLTVGLGTAGVFTMTSGVINMQNIDILLVGTTAGIPGDAFSYAGGTINATTPAASLTTVPLVDNSYGELTFAAGAAQSFNTVAGLVIPNLTINAASPVTYTGGGVAGAPTFTVSKYLKQGANIVMGTAGNLVFSDGAWIEMVAGTMDLVPAFGTSINYVYNTAGAFVTGKELTTSATKIQQFWNAPGGANAVTLNAATTVNNELRLVSGNLLTTAVKTMTMAANTLVTRVDGKINVAATTGANLLGGPYNLTYINTAATTTLSGEYPTTNTILKLTVATNIAVPTVGGAAAPLALHASRSCGDFELVTDGAAVPQNGTQFDLAGFTLTVTNVPTATLTRGALVSYANAGGFYTYGTLAVAGTLTQTANASIKNVIVTAATATLAGSFGTEDYEGTGAAPNVSATLPTMTVTGNATVAGFNGNLTVNGNTTINGAYTGGSLAAGGNVTVGTGGSFAAATNLTFFGSVDATLTIPTAGATVGAVTFNKTTGTIYKITLAGGNLAATGTVTFTNGLFIVPDPLIFNIPAPLLGGGQGFTHVVAATDLSHVVGLLSKTLRNTTGLLAGATETRSEFPIGSLNRYRKVALTFPSQFGVPTVPNITIIANHVDASPTGAVELPITNGVAQGIDIARYPAFYWNIKTSPTSVSNVFFDLELGATGFSDYDDINNVRIIRRHGTNTGADQSNQWLFQGDLAAMLAGTLVYDNELNNGIPSIINRNSNAGLRSGGAIFTLGLKSNMSIKTAIPKQYLVLSAGVKSYLLTNLFKGNIGVLSYTATSSNNTIATVAVVGSSLAVTPVAIGDAVITVKASDAANNDFFAYSFAVNVGLTDVEGEAIPTEFALYQNFPNPFNPTTNIKFALPKESSVTLKIYNVLGQEVETLVNKVMNAGYHTVDFNATKLSSGMYIYRIQAGDFVQVKKMLLMK
ncbi:MAG: T9SS type A sorting domain-containing protein [Ignavibacteriales bacterium]|nr:T9SS type A sorting domain-containing protein [Ignavibacteriales bacterium]